MRWIRTSVHRDRVRVSTDWLVASPIEAVSPATSHDTISAHDFGRARITAINTVPDDEVSQIRIECADMQRCVQNEATGVPRSDGFALNLYCGTDDDATLLAAFEGLQGLYRADPHVSERALALGFASPRRPVNRDDYPLVIALRHASPSADLRRLQRSNLAAEIDFDLDALVYSPEALLDGIHAALEAYDIADRRIASVATLRASELEGSDYQGFFYLVDVSQSHFVGSTPGGADVCNTTISVSRAHTTAATPRRPDGESFFHTVDFGEPRSRTAVHRCGAGEVASEATEMLHSMILADWR